VTRETTRKRLLPLALLAVATTACGSTVTLSGPTSLAGPAGSAADGLAVPGAVPGDGLALPGDVAGPAAGSAGASAAAGGAAVASTSTGTSTTATEAAAPAAARATAPGGPVAHGPGVTATTISIGFPYAPNADQAQAALGNSAVTQGDPKRVVEALVADINRNGGVAGRKLVVVFHELDAQSSETQAQQEQGLCSTFTEDHKVLAVLGASGELLRDCLAKSGVINATGSIADLNQADFDASPFYYDASGYTMDGLARSLVSSLSAQRYFTPWDHAAGAAGGALPVKVGILVPDKPSWIPVIRKVLLPELKAAGNPVAEENVRFWHFPESAAGNSQAVTEIQAIVLRFRSDDVTHVLPMEQNSLAFFTPAAEGQGYRPRYGLTTATAAQAYAGSLVPYRQLHGAVGVGWFPTLDLPESKQTDAHSGPGRKACLDTMARAEVSYGSTNAKAIALLLCDAFYAFDTAIELLPEGGSIAAATFMPALERTGGRFQVATLPAGGFRPGRRYPVTEGYPWAFSISCQCMEYVGARAPLR
jgi:hypothetical protein